MAITDFGSRIERFPEILNDIEELQRELIDPSINNRDDEFLSENNMIISEQLGKCKEFLDAVKDSWDISKAEGFALDNLLQLKKVYRVGASKSYTDSQFFYGSHGAVVPSGTVLISSTTEDVFVTTQTLTLTPSSAFISFLRIPSVQEYLTYSLTINGRIYSYTATPSDTIDTVYDAFANLFQDNPIPNVTLISSKEQDEIVINSLNRVPVNTVMSSTIVAKLIGSATRAEAIVVGATIAPTGTVNKLQRPLNGIETTLNTQAYIVGRLRESDEEFRRRGISSVSTDGTATVPSIVGGVYNNVPNISSVFLVENDTHLFDANGRPPHSYEVIIFGGSDEDIGNELWRTKPSSISTYGNTEVVVRDSNNNLRTLYFTRPDPVIIAIRIEYSIYDEEIFPVNGNALIRQAVIDHINTLGIGKDVIVGRISAAIYNSLSNQGLDEVLVQTQVIPSSSSIPSPSSWSEDRISISNAEYAATSSPDVYLEEM